MRILLTINDKPYYNEEMGELEVAPGLTFEQTVEAKEKAAKLFIKKFQYKIDQVEKFKGKTMAYMVFDSKVNEVIKDI